MKNYKNWQTEEIINQEEYDKELKKRKKENFKNDEFFNDFLIEYCTNRDITMANIFNIDGKGRLEILQAWKKDADEFAEEVMKEIYQEI